MISILVGITQEKSSQYWISKRDAQSRSRKKTDSSLKHFLHWIPTPNVRHNFNQVSRHKKKKWHCKSWRIRMICIVSLHKIIRSWLLCVTTNTETRRRSQSDWRTFHEIKHNVTWVIAMNERNDLMSLTATDWLRKTLFAPLHELTPERLYSHEKKCLT